MQTTLLLYISLLALLGGTTVWLVLRDLARGAAQRQVDDEADRLLQLPLAVDDPPPRNLAERIDQYFRRLIYQSGLEITPEPAFLLIVFFGLLVGSVLFIWRDDILMGVLGMALGMAAPLAYYVRARQQRVKELREQLPDAMDLMARAVRAGETLEQALDSVGRNSQEPLRTEFQRASRQLEMGLSVSAAMRSLNRRAPLIELKILATALNVQRRSGGNLAQTVERLAGVIRDRLSFQRQFMAATGASRMGTILISLAGPAVFVYMLIWQPDYVGQFFAVPGGWMLLATAVGLQLVGLIWIAGVLRNEY